MQISNELASLTSPSHEVTSISTMPPPPLVIPTIQPDELLMSYINRLKEANALEESLLKTILREHYESLNTSGEKLFFLDFIGNLVSQDLDEFIQNHTMSPESHTYDNLYKNRKVNPYSISFIFKRAAKFCPHCSQEEHAQQGYSYWHRWHQIRGVYMCDSHDTPLVISKYSKPFDTQPHRLLKNNDYSEQQINFGKSHPEIIKYLYLAKSFLRNKYSINFPQMIERLVEKDLELNGYQQTKFNKKPISRFVVRAYPNQWLFDHFPLLKQLAPTKHTIRLDAIVKLRRYEGALIPYLLYFAYLFDVSEILEQCPKVFSDGR